MRKIDINNYYVEALTPEGNKQVPYDVKKTLTIILFHPKLELSAYELFEHNKLALKIEAATEYVLLEESEYAILHKSITTVKGYTKDDLEFVKRVLEAPQINVKEG